MRSEIEGNRRKQEEKQNKRRKDWFLVNYLLDPSIRSADDGNGVAVVRVGCGDGCQSCIVVGDDWNR